MRGLFRYLFRYKGMTLARIITNVGKAACSVWLSVLLGGVLDNLTSLDKNSLMNSVLRCIALITVLVIVSALDIIVTTLQTKKLLGFMKKDIFSKIINGNIEQYRSMHSGKYISILNNDINMINESFVGSFFELIFQLLSFGLSLGIMLEISPLVTCIIILISIISIVVVSRVSERLMKQQMKFSESLENITKLVSDIFSGILVIKNYNITGKIEEIYCNNDAIVEEQRKKYHIIIGLINILMVCFSMLTYLTIILFCAYSVINGTLSAGTALIVIQLSSNLSNPINEIISLVSEMYSVKGIGEKIERLAKWKETDVEEGIEKEAYIQKIVMDNVTFGYDEKRDAIIRGVSLQIEKGKKYAIVGESGSGKTTLLKLLLRYYDDYTGNIFMDGENIRKIKAESYCQLVSAMEQDSFIFDETLRDNICLYQKYGEEEIESVIDKAGLAQVVQRLPKGMQTVLGEGGANLSGGECKRVAFARLLLKKTPILLLDEATSNLDNNTTMKIEGLVLGNRDLTLVSVTHKLVESILRRYDEVIVLKRGKVVEQGSFDQLINQKGYFYNLYNAQTMCV